ncbi:hypothetical protein CCH79_00018982, partial [Gambusia affinis]
RRAELNPTSRAPPDVFVCVASSLSALAGKGAASKQQRKATRNKTPSYRSSRVNVRLLGSVTLPLTVCGCLSGCQRQRKRSVGPGSQLAANRAVEQL